MTEKKTTKPEMIEDKDLDDASGGLLLPAVQKVREAAANQSSTTSTSSHSGGANFSFGDGSVR